MWQKDGKKEVHAQVQVNGILKRKKKKPSLMMLLIIYTRFVDRTRMNCRHKRVSGGSQIKDWIFMVTIIIRDKAKVRNSLYILEFN